MSFRTCFGISKEYKMLKQVQHDSFPPAMARRIIRIFAINYILFGAWSRLRSIARIHRYMAQYE
jgi:hypothetical protein